MVMDEEASTMDFEMSMRTARLEKEYEKTLSDSARLLDGERDRVRRMEHLFLKFENEALRLQLEESNGHLLGFSRADSEACVQLQDACQEIDRLESQAQTSSNEISRLKEELSTRKSNSTSYNTILAEKVQLSRDFAALQSEVERLRAQDISYQAIVAEKHELERETNSLGVQLDNEKHAHQRTQAKVSEQTTELTKLSARIEELQNELARELRAKQQQERDSHQQNSGWDSHRASLEGKVESLNKQLRSTKAKLHEVQAELQQRGSLKTHTINGSEPGSRTVPLQRPGPSGHSGVEIATPGAVRVQKRVERDSALPGDKSAFSITPFLNRTGAPSDSPMSSVMGEDGADDAHTPLEAFPKGNKNSEPKRIGSALRRQISPTQERNPIAKSTKPKPKVGTTGGSAPKEAKKTINRQERMDSMEADELYDHFAENDQAKPKKRKLGGQRDRSLFEEDEEEGEPRQNKKVGRKLAMGNGLQKPIASASERLPRALGFGVPMGFSPLKRDRKRL